MESFKDKLVALMGPLGPSAEKLINHFSNPRRLISLILLVVYGIVMLVKRIMESKKKLEIPKDVEINMVQGKNYCKEDKKRKLLVVVFATWCGPCKKCVPHLNEISEKQKLSIIAIAGDSEDDVKKFIDENKPKYAVGYVKGHDKVKLFRDLGIRSFPNAFLFNEEGEHIWRGHPIDPRLISALNDTNKKEKQE